jgi:hypothetical protein
MVIAAKELRSDASQATQCRRVSRWLRLVMMN